jgi:hypothetical protein
MKGLPFQMPSGVPPTPPTQGPPRDFGTPLSRRPNPCLWAGFSLARFLSAVTSRESQQQNTAMEQPWRGFGARHAEDSPYFPHPNHDSQSAKAHSCDRHHIASATAVLPRICGSYRICGSFYVPPKHSAPLMRGLFCIGNFRPPLCLPSAASMLTERGIALCLMADLGAITKYFTQHASPPRRRAV